jgi:hypothetical protein
MYVTIYVYMSVREPVSGLLESRLRIATIEYRTVPDLGSHPEPFEPLVF